MYLQGAVILDQFLLFVTRSHCMESKGRMNRE